MYNKWNLCEITNQRFYPNLLVEQYLFKWDNLNCIMNTCWLT